MIKCIEKYQKNNHRIVRSVIKLLNKEGGLNEKKRRKTKGT
jgi:hypothetical protein